MANHRNRFPARRRFLKQSTVLTASVVALPTLAKERPAETRTETEAERLPARAARTGQTGRWRRRKEAQG